MRQRWEGNARELENAIERALVLCSGQEIAPEDLAFEDEGGATPDGASFEETLLAEAFRKRMTVRELTDLYIERVLTECGGSKMEAARILGLNRRTLYRRDERAVGVDEEPPVDVE
jgi:two-component system, NtrC family, response regulator AtoC